MEPKYVVLSIQDELFPFPCYFGDTQEERAFTFSLEEASEAYYECQGDAIIIDIANRRVVTAMEGVN